MSVISLNRNLSEQNERQLQFDLHSYFEKIWPNCKNFQPLNPSAHLKPQALAALTFKKDFFKNMAEIIPFGVDISDKSIFKRTISSMGLKVSNDVWNHITDDDVIEVYNGDFLQIAHNFSFMNYCSYHPVDLCTYEWWELFSRDIKITEALAEAGNQVFRGKVKTFAEINSPKHIVKELLSKNPYCLEVEQGIMAPVFDNGIIVAGITTLRAKHINIDN